MQPEKVDEVIELLKTGMKLKFIASQTGMSISTVSEIALKNGLRRNQTQRSFLEKNKHLITAVPDTVCQYCGR